MKGLFNVEGQCSHNIIHSLMIQMTCIKLRDGTCRDFAYDYRQKRR